MWMYINLKGTIKSSSNMYGDHLGHMQDNLEKNNKKVENNK